MQLVQGKLDPLATYWHASLRSLREHMNEHDDYCDNYTNPKRWLRILARPYILTEKKVRSYPPVYKVKLEIEGTHDFRL